MNRRQFVGQLFLTSVAGVQFAKQFAFPGHTPGMSSSTSARTRYKISLIEGVSYSRRFSHWAEKSTFASSAAAATAVKNPRIAYQIEAITIT